MRSNRSLALIALLAAALVGCEERSIPVQPEASPELSLVQTGPSNVEVQIAGRYGLRALQARIAWDPSAMRITGVVPGAAARRLDRVFHGDLAAAEGSLVVGLTDTRKVLLPARGTLLVLQVASAGDARAATIELRDAVGSIDGGEGVSLAGSAQEVELP